MPTKLDLKIEHQMCRGLGHSWDPYTPGIGVRKAPWGQRLYLLCTRCGMTRHDTFDLLGELSTRKYKPPTDYRLSKDETPNIQQLRRSIATALHDGDLDRAQKLARRQAIAKGRGEAKRVTTAVKRAPAKRGKTTTVR